MKDNWSFFVPYIAVVTAVQFGITGVAKFVGAFPYKKLDRLGKCIESAVSLATGALLAFLFFSVAGSGGRIADSPRGERIATASGFLQVYAVLFAFFLIWTSAIIFGGIGTRAFVLGLTVVGVLVNLGGLPSPEVVETMRTVFGRAVAGVVAVTMVVIVCAEILPARLRSPVLELWHRTTSNLALRRVRFISWLEPTETGSGDNKSV
ncbi:hypothetical protein JK358_37285 [Nocardia sp. 2]|uniref:Uncharacterized protein n=1 Tax=Nocardia acididurans TaxID=2802282 RepID=A0ABS1MHN6_9NOCA|nr:hypothetical protein [Nocardia acididurans]MBL1080066.1 hypothetical protein [Nocardia acididurans]